MVMSSTQQLINVEEKPLSIKLSNTAVLQQLRVFGEETNTSSHEKESVIVSLIGKQKTYKSTHANLLFGTNFPKGMLGMQQTTKGILVESSVISDNAKKVNLHCLDYEGFGSTGRDMTSDEEKALDNKLMLLAYSISNIVIFSMHAAEVTTFREFSQLMKMCVKGMKTNDQSKKPTLIIFVNVSFGDKNSLISNVLNGGMGKSQDEIREGIHGYATQALLAQNDFKECKLYFSEVIVQTLYPNQMGNQTEGFIMDHLKQLVYEKSFSSQSQDSPILFDEERWKGTVESINLNEQIEFASDILGRLSETTCSNKCELLKREFLLKSTEVDGLSELNTLKSELILEYWKEAKGTFAKEYGTNLNDFLEENYKKQSPKIILKQINQIANNFKEEMSSWMSKDGVTNQKLKNLKSNFIEKWEHEFSMQEFIRLTERINNIYEELLEDFSFSKMVSAEQLVKSHLEKKVDFTESLNLIEETREYLLSFQLVNSPQVIKWSERYETLISNKKAQLDLVKYQKEQQKTEIREMKVSFLDSLAQASQVDQMDLLLKKYLLIIERYPENQTKEYEQFFRQHHEEKLTKYILPHLLADIEDEFKNSLNSIQTNQALDNQYELSIKKYQNYPQHPVVLESMKKLNTLNNDYLNKFIIPRIINDIEQEFQNSLKSSKINSSPHSLENLYKSTIKKYAYPNHSLSMESMSEMKKLYDDYYNKSIPVFINQIEIDFQNAKISSTSFNNLEELYNSTIKKYSVCKHALVNESIKKLKTQYIEYANERGKALFTSGNTKEARIWLDHKHQNDAICQFYLGEIYRNDTDGPDSQTTAFEWFKKSSYQGNIDATFQLAECYDASEFRSGVCQDRHEALRLYRVAANEGHCESCKRLGGKYRFGGSIIAPHVDRSVETAIQWYEKAANQGDVDAMQIIGNIYSFEYHITPEFKQDKTKAKVWYEKAAKLGDTKSEYYLGQVYYEEEDYTQAFKSFEKAANQGKKEAEIYLADLYINGHGVNRDYNKGFDLALKSANRDETYGQYLCGFCYVYGRGVEMNSTSAKIWLEKAEKQGNEAARQLLKKIFP